MRLKQYKTLYLSETLTSVNEEAIEAVKQQIASGAINSDRFGVRDALKRTGAFGNEEDLESATEKIITKNFVPSQAGSLTENSQAWGNERGSGWTAERKPPKGSNEDLGYLYKRITHGVKGYDDDATIKDGVLAFTMSRGAPDEVDVEIMSTAPGVVKIVTYNGDVFKDVPVKKAMSVVWKIFSKYFNTK